ncbi:MAG: hypothetical protein ACIARR_08275 [Phycisphaerales bacterium JB059]
MRGRVVMSAVVCGAIASGAAAQADAWSELEAVDQGVADVSPLSESLRLELLDMRVSDGFTRVYRLEGINGWQDQYVRRDGAITAVFPQSVYLPAEYGGGIAIPAGTVFLIGAPPDWMRERYDFGASSSNAAPTGGFAVAPVDGRLAIDFVDTSAPVVSYATPRTRSEPARVVSAPAERPPTPWATDHRRGARVSSLLSLAATGD